MMLKCEQPVLAYGTMGGEGQPQTQAALVTRMVEFGYDVQQAIEAPRWLMGRTWGTASRNLSLESRISDEVAPGTDATRTPCSNASGSRGGGGLPRPQAMSSPLTRVQRRGVRSARAIADPLRHY